MRGSIRPVEADARDWLGTVGAVAAGLVSFLVLAFYDRLVLGPLTLDAGDPIPTFVRAVADGSAAAPYQYRPFVPWFLDWMWDAGVGLHSGAYLVDLVAVGASVLGAVVLFRRAGEPALLLPATGWVAVLGIGIAFYPKPETFPSLAVTTFGLVVLADRRLPRPWLVPVAVLLAGMRTDLIAAIGVGFVVRARLGGRSSKDLACGAALLATSVAASVAWTLVYPDARYDSTAGFVQVRYNADVDVLLVAAAVLALPVLAIVRSVRSQPLDHPDVVLGLPLVAPLLFEVASVAVVGRLDEIRIFLPLGWGAALGMLLLLRAALEPSSRLHGRPEVAEAHEGEDALRVHDL